MKFLKGEFSDSRTNRILYGFLLIDMVFISIHFVIGILFAKDFITDYNDYAHLLVTRDQNYPEFFQYAKYILIIIALLSIIRRYKEYRFIAWILFFVLLLLDDSLMIHENVGEFLADRLAFQPAMGLRAVDLGELIYAAVLGCITMSALFISYKNGPKKFKVHFINLSLLVGVLLFFGVVVDMIHIILDKNVNVKFILGMVEDGSEMLVLSALVWYSFFMYYNYTNHTNYLHKALMRK